MDLADAYTLSGATDGGTDGGYRMVTLPSLG
jgi:hypothetical protein